MQRKPCGNEAGNEPAHCGLRARSESTAYKCVTVPLKSETRRQAGCHSAPPLAIFNPNRPLNRFTCFFLTFKGSSVILPASVGLFSPARPRRSPLRLRASEEKTSRHKQAV